MPSTGSVALDICNMTWFYYLLLIPIILSAVFWLATTVCVAIFMHLGKKKTGSIGLPDEVPAISLIKPVCGLEKNLYANLSTACRQNYPDFEVIFTVQSSRDPALKIVEALRADFPEEDIKVVVDSNTVGVNGKVNNIYNASLRARGKVLVISDSDMHLEPDYLRQITAPLQDDRVGIACTLYQAWRPSNLLEALELLTYNCDFVPSMLFAYVTKTSIAAPGATMSIRLDVLAEVGGLPPLGDYFVEDFELGRRVVAKGYQIALIPYIAKMDMDLTSSADWWRHQVYWDQNTKSVNAAGFFFTLLVRGVPFALLYALLGGTGGWWVMPGAVGLRIFTGIMNALLLKDKDGLKFIWLLPLRDLLGIFVWLVSLFKKQTHWRGKFYTLKKGKMVSVK